MADSPGSRRNLMHEPSGVFLMIHTLLSDVWESGENRVSGAGKTCKAPAVGAWWASIQRGAVGCGPALSDNLPFQGSLVFFRQDYLRSRRWHEGIAPEASEVGEGQMSGPAGHLAGGCRQGAAEPVGRAAHHLRWTAAILCLGTILPAPGVGARGRVRGRFDWSAGSPSPRSIRSSRTPAASSGLPPAVACFGMTASSCGRGPVTPFALWSGA